MGENLSSEHDDMAGAAKLRLVYDGPALETHKIDVRELAPALLAFNDLLDRANEILNGDDTRIKVKVTGSFQSGSFGVDVEVLQSLITQITGIFAGNYVTGTLNLLGVIGIAERGTKGLLWIVKKLKGKPVEVVEVTEDGRYVIAIDQEKIEIEAASLKLLNDFKIRKALDDLIAKPLAHPGIDTFAVMREDRKGKLTMVEEIEDDEAPYFRAPASMDDTEVTQEFSAILRIRSVSFEGNMWKVSDGDVNMNVALEDEDFNDKIARHEVTFGKDDLLEVIMRRTQVVSKGTLKTKNAIIKVKRHKTAKQFSQPDIEFPE